MKKVRMRIRLLAWPCFIIGMVLVMAWAFLVRWPGLDIPIASKMPIDMVFYLGAGMGLIGVIVALIVEDDSSWDSICQWIEGRKDI